MGTNPFIDRGHDLQEEQVAPEEHVESDVVLGDRISTMGPSQPLASREGSTPPPHLPVAGVAESASVLVAGVHGGAGVSTLVDLLDGYGVDTGRAWPSPNPWVNGSSSGGVLLVARTHARGRAAARAVLTAWHAGAYVRGVPLLGVCLVDDAPKLSKEQVSDIKKLTAMAPHGWHMPWQEVLRHEVEPTASSGRVTRMLKSIRNHADKIGTSKG